MLFCMPLTSPICRPKANGITEDGLINNQGDVRDWLQQPKPTIVDSSSSLGALAGWGGGSSRRKEAGTLLKTELVEITSLFEAIRETVRLRELLRETREEIDVLAEALEYARSICHEK